MTRLLHTLSAFTLGIGLLGCNQETSSRTQGDLRGGEAAGTLSFMSWRKPRPSPSPSPSLSSYPSPSPSPSPSPATSPLILKKDVLIFNGSGTSPTDFQALVNIVSAHSLSYTVATSPQFETMTLDQMSQYRLILWPGGDSNVMSASLSGATRTKVRSAVVNRGVNYVGFCAGAWMAVGPTPPTGGNPYWGLSILKGDYLKIYQPNPGGTMPVSAMVLTTFANGSDQDLVWWGGPYLPSLNSTVIGKYPNGSAAIIESPAGSGYVVLSGPHPEAPQDWRDSTGLVDTDGSDVNLAWNLIESALLRSSMGVF